VAELALLACTVVALVPYTQVFSGDELFVRLLVAAVASHLLAAVLRRRRAPFAVLVGVLVVGFVLVGTWAAFPDTTRWLLPSAQTVRALGDSLSSSLDRANQDAVPVPVEPGFVVVTFAATWLSAAVADRAAFRWWLVLQALVPALALFLVGAVLSPRAADARSAVGAAFLVAALLFVLCQRPLVAHHRLRWTWSAGGGPSGRRRQSGVGLALVALVGVAAAVAVPALPGGDGDSVVDWRPDADGGGNRSTVTPLVDIRSRLVDQSNELIFTVEAAQPDYWRLTALDVFDGRIWRSNGEFTGADGALEQPDDELVGREVLHQRFQLESLGQIWLPAAFRPITVEPGDVGVRFDEESGTLIVDDDRDDSDGIEYAVDSAPPDQDPAVLAAATDPVPPDVAQRYLALPDGSDPQETPLAPQVVDLAQEVTAGAATPYEQALALQAFFLDGSFTYDLDVAPGHGSGGIESFLEDRRGYCEQFAGTYAAMARAVGLPSRVAVGYQQGELDPTDPQRYLVRGADAHAWPEVWLTGVGWIRMEPTPPDPDDPVSATTSTTAPDPSSTTTAVPPSGGSAEPEPEAATPDLPAAAPRGPIEAVTEPLGGAALPLVLLVLVVAVVLGLGALGGSRVRRRRRQGPPGDRIHATWALLLHDLAAAGLLTSPSDTPFEVADRARPLRLVEAEVLDELAQAETAARWAPGGLDQHAGRGAEALADQVADLGELVEEAVDGRLDRRRRWLRRVDPRQLWWRPTGVAGTEG
jgi:transglutaminase-like putative cysteine protease